MHLHTTVNQIMFTHLAKPARVPRMKKSTDRANTIKTRRQKLKLSQEDLAKLIGVTRVAVSYWEKGGELRGDNLLKLSQVLDLDPNFLNDGQEPDSRQGIIYKNGNNSIIIRAFPVLQPNEIRPWLADPAIIASHRVVNMPILDEKYSAGTFLFENIGKAMINRENLEESLFPNEIALVDPSIHPTDGCLVLAEFGENDIRIRQYREDGAYKFLQAFDPTLKPTELNEAVKIIGTIMGSYRSRK